MLNPRGSKICTAKWTTWLSSETRTSRGGKRSASSDVPISPSPTSARLSRYGTRWAKRDTIPRCRLCWPSRSVTTSGSTRRRPMSGAAAPSRPRTISHPSPHGGWRSRGSPASREDHESALALADEARAVLDVTDYLAWPAEGRRGPRDGARQRRAASKRRVRVRTLPRALRTQGGRPGGRPRTGSFGLSSWDDDRMAVPSTMLALGTKAPDFELPDVVTGGRVSSVRTSTGKRALLVMFICRHCPYVKHVRDGARAAGTRLRRAPSSRSSRSARTTPPSTRRTRPRAWRRRLGRPGTRSRTCSTRPRTVAKAYTAACTPDFFLFDADRALVYRGQLDDSRPSNGLPGHRQGPSRRDRRGPVGRARVR